MVAEYWTERSGTDVQRSSRNAKKDNWLELFIDIIVEGVRRLASEELRGF